MCYKSYECYILMQILTNCRDPSLFNEVIRGKLPEDVHTCCHICTSACTHCVNITNTG